MDDQMHMVRHQAITKHPEIKNDLIVLNRHEHDVTVMRIGKNGTSILGDGSHEVYGVGFEVTTNRGHFSRAPLRVLYITRRRTFHFRSEINQEIVYRLTWVWKIKRSRRGKIEAEKQAELLLRVIP